MDYYGQELPAKYKEPIGKKCKVGRMPEELFSPETIASFEGKPVTNTHPTSNLDINTAAMTKRGHVQNVRPEGDFLLGDLFIDDVGLISEIKNDLKREVSCGYDCLWVPYGNKNDSKYEQKEIRGNHVAIVQSGRAGPRVAIQDQKPKEGGKKMPSITRELLAAIGLKHWAQDAEPEDIQKAMDAMQDDKDKDPDKKDVKGEDMKEKEEDKKLAKDADESAAEQNKEDKGYKELADKIKSLSDEIAAMKKDKSDKKAEDAKTVMDSIEKELDEKPEDKKEEAKDEDPDKDKEEDKKETKDCSAKDEDADLAEVSGGAADAMLRKFVQDMKPVIMEIPDEGQRLAMANRFRTAVQGARSHSNSYGDIASKVASNRMAAMDQANSSNPQSFADRSLAACQALANSGEKLRGDK